MTTAAGILYNPISGDGRARELSTDISAVLRGAGVECSILESKPAYARGELESWFQKLTCLIVCGGDGTLRPLLQPLSEAGVPVYMVPLGNESLFARAFGMSVFPNHVALAVKAHQVSEHCFGYVNDQPFFSMVSVGLDSAVIQRISRTRTKSIGHRGYIRPTIEALLKLRVPRLVISVDRQSFVNGEQGYVNVANCARYAQGLNPVPEACSSDGTLHARFVPHVSKWWYLRWLIPLALRSPVTFSNSRLFEGKELMLDVIGESFPVQADGEYAGTTPVKVRISEKTFRVLEPSRVVKSPPCS